MTAADPAAAPLPTIRTLYGLAWPMAVKAIMLHGTVVIDAYLVSGLGEQALAVIGLSAAITGLLLGLIFSFAHATQIRVAQAFGTGDAVFLKSALVSGLAISVAVALAGLAVLALGGASIIDAFAHDAWIAGQARGYLAIFALVILAEAVSQCITSFFNGCGDTRLPLYSYLLSVPVNVLASLAFIYGHFGAPELGVIGAAVGSAIAAVLQMAFLAASLLRRTDGYRGVAGWRNGSLGATLRRHLAFSLPIAVTFGSATVATSVCGLLYATLPVNQFAAMTIIMPWVQVVGTFGMSWAQATGILVAQLLGRRVTGARLDGFLSGAWRGAFVAAGVVSGVYAAVCLASGWIYADLSAETRGHLMSFLPVLLVLPFPKGSNAICGNTLRAGGETLYVMHVFIWSAWLFRVPATALMLLWFDLSVTWIFSLLLIEELLKFPAFHSRLFKGDWKRAEALA